MGFPDDSIDLLIKYGVDFSEAGKETDTFVTKASQKFRQKLTPAAEEASEAIEGTGKSSRIAGTAIGAFIGHIAVKAFSFLIDTVVKLTTKLANMAINFIKDGVEMNATLQQLNLAFVTMTGSQENADAVLSSISKRAALLGQDFQSMARLTRGLFPFSGGDVETLDDMLTLSQQLAILDPIAGFRGAGRALREAMSGNVRSLSAIFELPLSSLNKLKQEFQETGDAKAFVNSIQELVGVFGVSAETIDAFRDTARGSLALLKFEFQEAQKILGAPIFASLQKHLKFMVDLLAENSDKIKEKALVIGAKIAAVIDVVATAIKNIIGFIKIANTLIDALKERFRFELIKTVTDVAEVVVATVNVVIDAINKVSGSKIEFIDFDRENFERNATKVIDTVAKVQDAIAHPFRTAGRALFPEFGDQVDAYVDQFSDLLKENEGGLTGLGDNRDEFQEEDAGAWDEHLRKIRDVLEKNQQAIEKEAERHHQKVESINRRSQERREDAVRKNVQRIIDLEKKLVQDIEDTSRDLDVKLFEIDRDAAEKRAEITEEITENVEEIEKDHVEAVLAIRQKLEDDLFDAIQSRSARRVFELVRDAKRDRIEAEKERDEALDSVKDSNKDRAAEIERDRQRRRRDALEDAAQRVEDLKRGFARRQEQLAINLQREFEQIQLNAGRQRALERENHARRMNDLRLQLNERLQILGRGWAEEGELNKEAMGQLRAAMEATFGPNGNFMQLMTGFNQGLITQAQTTARIISDMASSLTLAGVDQMIQKGFSSQTSSQSSPFGGGDEMTLLFNRLKAFRGSSSFAENVGNFQHGFDGVVDKPFPFIAAEDGRPERVTVTPLARSSNMGDSGMGGIFIHIVRADRNFSRSFEASLTSKISQVVGDAVAGRRRTRRG